MKLECVHIVSGIIREVLCSECLKHFVFKEITRYIFKRKSNFRLYALFNNFAAFPILHPLFNGR